MDFAGASLNIQPVGDDKTIAALDKIDRRVEQSTAKWERLTTDQLNSAAARYDAMYGKSTAAGEKAAAAAERQAERQAAAAERAAQRMGRAEVAAYADEERAASSAAAAAEREAARVANASEQMATRSNRSTAGMARGLEMVARTGALTGRSMDAVLGNVANLATGFSASGPLIGAIAIAGGAIVELFMRTSRELEKLQLEFNNRLDEMAKRGAGGLGSIAGRNGLAASLYSGDPFAAIIGQNPKESDLDFLARSQGIEGLRRRQAQLQSKISALPDRIGYAADASGLTEYKNQLEALNVVLTRMEEQHSRVLKVMGDKQNPGIVQQVVDEVTAGITASSSKKDIKDLFHPPSAGGGFTDPKYSLAAARNMPATSLTPLPKEEELRIYEEILAKEYQLAKTEQERLSINSQMVSVLKQIDDIKAKSRIDITSGQIEKSVKEAQARAVQTMSPQMAQQEADMEQWGQRVIARAQSISQSIGKTIGGGIQLGIESAFAKGATVGSVFDKLTGYLLSALGDMAIQFGTESAAFLTLMKTIKDALTFFMPEIGLPAAFAMIALGATLKGVGSRLSSSSAGGGGSASTPLGLQAITGRSYINPSAPAGTATSANAITPRAMTQNVFNVIGPDDPRAGRAIRQLLDNHDARG